MSEFQPKAISERPPLGWRLWWRLGFIPYCRLVHLLTRSEIRREAWISRVDIWAMNTYRKVARGEKPWEEKA